MRKAGDAVTATRQTKDQSINQDIDALKAHYDDKIKNLTENADKKIKELVVDYNTLVADYNTRGNALRQRKIEKH